MSEREGQGEINDIQDVETMAIYSPRVLQLLKIASEAATSASGNGSDNGSGVRSSNVTGMGGIGVRGRANYSDSESDSDEDSDRSSSDSGSEKDVGDVQAASATSLPPSSTISPATSASSATVGTAMNQQQTHRKNKSNNKKKDKYDLMKQMGSPPSLSITIGIDDERHDNQQRCAHAIKVPSALLSNAADTTPLNNLYQLSNNLSKPNHRHGNHKSLILIVTLQSGRFAAALFHQQKCIHHTTSTRYTARKGQGGAQSSNDNAKGKAKSVGSQLRRAGEVQLRNDVKDMFIRWKDDLIHNTALFMISLSKNLQKGFWEDATEVLGSSNGMSANTLFKKSPFVRKIPLDVGRPNYEGCCAIYDLMTSCVLQKIDVELMERQQELYQQDNPSTLEPIQEQQHDQEEGKSQKATIVLGSDDEAVPINPLTPLHEAARSANVDQLLSLLSLKNHDSDVDDIDIRAGNDSMTPLHYAADAPNTAAGMDASAIFAAAAAKCVYTLLVEGHANPCVLDSRNRPPYYLSKSEVIRNAFRKARAELGEDMWNWTEGAKVGPPLSDEDVIRKREKAAEKKRRQRQRQKERKAKDQAEKMEAERRAMKLEEKKEREEETRRASGRRPGEIPCDFCHKGCKRKSQMFSRLNFYYCSTECVKKHQRELMATAAAARFSKK